MILEAAWLLVLLLSMLVPPASAAYKWTGLLAWSFDDITVNSGIGRVHDSQWAQSYKMDLDGPLVLPVIGVMHDGVSYSEGSSLSQTVNTGIPHQQTATFLSKLDLFSPRLQQFFHLSPNFSRSYIRQSGISGGQPFANSIMDASWGFYSGVSLPRLPALTYSRQINDHSNSSDLNQAQQTSTTENKTFDYTIGHLVAHAGEQTDQLRDLLGATPPRKTDFQQAWLEENEYQPKWARLQSFYFRADASKHATNGADTSELGSLSLGLATMRFKTGSWDSSVNYAVYASRDFLIDRESLSQNATLNGTRAIRNGRWINSLGVSQSPDVPSESVSDLLGLNQHFLRNRLGTNFTISGGLNRSPSATRLSNGASARLDLSPRPSRKYFAEAMTSGTEFLRGSDGGSIGHFSAGPASTPGTDGSRVNRYSAGMTDYFNTRSLTALLQRTESRNYGTANRSVSDQFSLETSGRPAPKLSASGGYGLAIVRQQEADSTVQNLHGSLDYNPYRGLTILASITYVNANYTTAATITYTLGKTSLSVSYEYRQISTPATYSHLRIALTRYL